MFNINFQLFQIETTEKAPAVVSGSAEIGRIKVLSDAQILVRNIDSAASPRLDA